MKCMVLAAAAALSLAPIGAAARAAAPTIAPLHYQSRTLANGLQVYALRDPGSANVSVQVWYDVGSRDDPRGRSGFAHLFEHLMFKSTRNLPAEEFDRLTEDVGGYNNASTNDDFTNYYEVVPANHLQRLLWAEAERMRSLVDRAGVLHVRARRGEGGAAQPRAGRAVRQAVLPLSAGDQLRRSSLCAAGDRQHRGSRRGDDRRSPRVPRGLLPARQCRAAGVGQFRAGRSRPLGRPIFRADRTAVLENPAGDGEEPARTAARHYTVYEPNTPLPAVLISYPSPPSSDPDAVTLEVLNAILSRGDSSRLHDSLVYRDRIASQVGSFFDAKQGRGNLAVYAILSGGKDAATGEASLRREVARLRTAPVSAAELKEAKTELLTAALEERETVAGRADELARAIVLAGDAKAADRRLRQIASVTPADIQRVARTWLREGASAAVRYLPEDSQKGAKEDSIGTSAKVQTAALVAPADIKIWQAAPVAERAAPPPPGPEITPAIPTPSVQRLANGLTVITVEKHDLPLVTATLVTGGGATADPADRAGTAELTAAVITEGTATRSATQIDRDVEALGASLDGDAGWDGSDLGLTVGTGELDKALAILADVARNATFPAEEVERQRTVAIDDVSVAMSDPGSVARLAALRALYGDAAYGHPSSGTAESLHAIGRDDLEAAYRSAWGPGATTLVLSGDIAPATARAVAERNFGTWAGQAAQQAAAASAGSAPLRGRLIVVDLPGSGQAAVRSRAPGFRAASRASIRRWSPTPSWAAATAPAQPGNPDQARPFLWLGQQSRCAPRAGAVHRRHPDPQRCRRPGHCPDAWRNDQVERGAGEPRGTDREAVVVDRRIRPQCRNHVGDRGRDRRLCPARHSARDARHLLAVGDADRPGRHPGGRVRPAEGGRSDRGGGRRRRAVRRQAQGQASGPGAHPDEGAGPEQPRAAQGFALRVS